jgi:RNA polymerase sigma factor (sigma-70 family)
VEVSALPHTAALPGLRGPSPLLRLQSDERLIALTRRGHHAAFETLCTRYQSRLLAFCRHMLSSREDAEDVLQEVFAAAFNAVLADDRPINVRPWLYRIARNRSLNHLRRATATGMDSMDVHLAEHGLSTSDKVMRRESFRELIGDVQHLPETQRTALLLREIDALSYEQIADAMETTVPSVKSLLVRARISLAEAAEARKLSCDEVRLELGEAAEGLIKVSSPARRHVRGCERCTSFKRALRENNHALALIMPVGPLLLIKKVLLAKLGSTASAGGAHVAGGAGASAGAAAGAAASTGGLVASGGGMAGGIMTAGAGALATKAAAGLAAAAIVTAGAVAADHAVAPAHGRHTAIALVAPAAPREAVVVREVSQPITPDVAARPLAAHRRALLHRATAHPALKPTTAPVAVTTPATATPAPPRPSAPPATEATQVTEVTSQTTQLPPAVTGTATTPPASTPPPASGAPESPSSAPPSGETATPPPSSGAPPTGTTGTSTNPSLPTAEPVPVAESTSVAPTGGTPAP